MAKSRLHQISELGQSVWIDSLSRGWLKTGALARWMDDGMWARWLLSRLPSGDDLIGEIERFLREGGQQGGSGRPN